MKDKKTIQRKETVKRQSTEEYLKEILGNKMKSTIESFVEKEVFVS